MQAMIVPSNRLLFWVAMLLPFAVLGALVPTAVGTSVTLLVGLLGVAILDAARGLRRLNGVHVALPALVRLSCERPGEITLRIRNESRKSRRMRIGLPLAESFRSDDDLTVLLPAGARESSCRWHCRPTVRGCFSLDSCYFEMPSPLGFWLARGRAASECELRVYPDLLKERRSLAALFLNRGTFGMHLQRMVGQGREFEHLREYIPGDSYEDIHWKATAKRGRPVTKLHQIERTQEVYVVIDSSRLSARPIRDEPVLERFLTAALVLCLAAERQGDLFGVLAFADKVGRFIRAGGGHGHYNACRDTLYTLQPRIVSPDFEDLCSFVRLNLRRRALLLILTDLSDPALAEGFARNVDMIGRQHLVLVNTILPPGVGPLFAGEPVADPRQLYERLGGQILWNELRELERTLRRRGVELSSITDEKMATHLVTQYLNVKRRQIL